MTHARLLPSLVALAVLATLLVAPPAPPASASSDYRQVVDLTFPMSSFDRYSRDYDACRGSGCSRRHRATDIMAPEGVTVHAAVGGSITYIPGLDGNPPSWGYMISIAGDDGRTYSYIHLGRQDGTPEQAYAEGMQRGTRVERGQHIGFNGCSGNASCSAPHVHFEIEDVTVTDPYGTNRLDPYDSLQAAEARGDLPSSAGDTVEEPVEPGAPELPEEPVDDPEPTAPVEDPGIFADVSVGHPFASEIQAMVDAGLTTGYTDGSFRPQGVVTRQAVAAFLYRAAGEPEGPFAGPGFADVPTQHPFVTEIAWLVDQGITEGYEDGTFRPQDAVTRQATAAFLYRAAGEPELDTGDLGFLDLAAGHPFASEIAWLVDEGISSGYDDGTFQPLREVTRQAAAAFLTR